MQLAGNQTSAGNKVSQSLRPAVTRYGRRTATAALVMGLFSVVGCGNNYRPVITAINPVGPAGQPTKYAVAISDPNLGDPNGTLPGLVTFVDFSGDTVLITANIGVKPYYLILGASGSTGITLNQDGTVNSFGISTSLLSSAVQQTTLLQNPTGAPLPTSIFPQGTYTYITQPGRASVAELAGSPLTLRQELAPVGAAPIYIAGVASAPRIYALSPSATAGSPGTATPIETSTNTPSTALPVGVNPVYGVMTADARRAFVMNQGSNTVSVIDAQNNQLDTGVTNGTIQDPNAVAPIWADFAPTLSELVVANEGTGTDNGSVSIFSIPLCSALSPTGNPNCNVNNPIDATGFGALVANIPVGKNPLMVGVLQDGTQAYVINQGDSTVSVINLKTNTVTATIPVPATPNPTFLAVTTGTPTGKVYVTSTTSKLMTVIRTDTNQVDTAISLQGYGIQVRMTAQ
ncbi:YncE family protein [Granulicella aggregans]|uniref:YncE family protein n=1 Tax=Granulicella aggregans TaxID=474949 RepID=UPI0021E0D0BF|nr:YncE family protein [Granulicella aggregans]